MSDGREFVPPNRLAIRRYVYFLSYFSGTEKGRETGSSTVIFEYSTLIVEGLDELTATEILLGINLEPAAVKSL